jgi:hypothetical protein
MVRGIWRANMPRASEKEECPFCEVEVKPVNTLHGIRCPNCNSVWFEFEQTEESEADLTRELHDITWSK